MANQRHIIDRFIDRQKQRVADQQKKIAEKAMDYLFAFSPHFIEGVPHATGHYDANHQISINGQGAFELKAPTGTRNRSVSKQLNDQEKLKANSIECGDEIEISNPVSYTMAVEHGFLVCRTWGKEGYKPYAKTRSTLKEEFFNVLE